MNPLAAIATVWTAITATTLSVLTIAYHVGAARERRASMDMPPAAETARSRHLYLVR